MKPNADETELLKAIAKHDKKFDDIVLRLLKVLMSNSFLYGEGGSKYLGRTSPPILGDGYLSLACCIALHLQWCIVGANA